MMINNGHALAQHLHACKCALDVSGPCLEICASSDWDAPAPPVSAYCLSISLNAPLI